MKIRKAFKKLICMTCAALMAVTLIPAPPAKAALPSYYKYTACLDAAGATRVKNTCITASKDITSNDVYYLGGWVLSTLPIQSYDVKITVDGKVLKSLKSSTSPKQGVYPYFKQYKWGFNGADASFGKEDGVTYSATNSGWCLKLNPKDLPTVCTVQVTGNVTFNGKNETVKIANVTLRKAINSSTVVDSTSSVKYISFLHAVGDADFAEGVDKGTRRVKVGENVNLAGFALANVPIESYKLEFQNDKQTTITLNGNTLTYSGVDLNGKKMEYVKTADKADEWYVKPVFHNPAFYAAVKDRYLNTNADWYALFSTYDIFGISGGKCKINVYAYYNGGKNRFQVGEFTLIVERDPSAVLVSTSGKGDGSNTGDSDGTEWKVAEWANIINCGDGQGPKQLVAVMRYEHANKTTQNNVRKKIAEFSRLAAENNNIGYNDARGRRGSYGKALLSEQNKALLKKQQFNPSMIAQFCEEDCSAGVCANIAAVGYWFNIGNLQSVNSGMTSGTAVNDLTNAGFVQKKGNYLTSSDYLLPGDILVYRNSAGKGHVSVVITEGKLASGEWNN